jgi:sugar phosphate isomerase/epimerase
MDRRYGFLAGLDFENWPVEQVVDALAETGYQAVSWPLARFDPRRTTLRERRRLLEITHAAGLLVSEWVLQLDYICLGPAEREQRIRHSLEVIRCVADLDPSAPVNIFSGPAPWVPSAPRLGVHLSEGQAWELLGQALDVIIPVAESLNVRLAVEGVFGHLVHDYYTTAELLRRYPSPNLGVNFDPSHGLLYGNDIPWVVLQLGEKIFHVHLKDAVGKPGGLPGETFIFPLLGEGNVDWGKFFTALDDIGYAGYLTVEFESFEYYKKILQNDPLSAARLSMEHLQHITSPLEGS